MAYLRLPLSSTRNDHALPPRRRHVVAGQAGNSMNVNVMGVVMLFTYLGVPMRDETAFRFQRTLRQLQPQSMGSPAKRPRL